MRMQQQFRDADNIIKDDPKQKFHVKHTYVAERDIIILYGLWRGWSPALIGRYCKPSSKSVRKHTIRVQSNPGVLFKLPILFTGMVGGKRIYRCEFCGNAQYAEERARIHVARHVTSEDFIHIVGVRGSGYLGMQEVRYLGDFTPFQQFHSEQPRDRICLTVMAGLPV